MSRYNFQPVALSSSGNALTFTCVGCAQRVRQPQDTVYADLSGESFKAYYCAPCKELLVATERHPLAEVFGTFGKIFGAAR